MFAKPLRTGVCLLRRGGRVAERDQAQAGPGSAVTAEICALNLKRKLHKYTKMCILFI